MKLVIQHCIAHLATVSWPIEYESKSALEQKFKEEMYKCPEEEEFKIGNYHFSMYDLTRNPVEIYTLEEWFIKFTSDEWFNRFK